MKHAVLSALLLASLVTAGVFGARSEASATQPSASGLDERAPTPEDVTAGSASGGATTCGLWRNTGGGLVQGTMCCRRNPFQSGQRVGDCPCSDAPEYCR